MDDNLKAQIRKRMEAKDTEDLLAIWTRADGEVWSTEAYALARETLVARGVEPPEPLSTDEAAESDEDDQDADDDDDDELYHNPSRLLDVASWSATLSWFFLVVGAIPLILVVVTLLSIFNNAATTSILPALLTLVALVAVALVSAFLFVLGQAVSQIVYVLVDIYEAVTPVAAAKA